MTIGNFCINRASKIKRVIKEKQLAYQRKELSDWDRKAFIQLFQVYQSRFLGICFYRTVQSDDKAWFKLNNNQL